MYFAIHNPKLEEYINMKHAAAAAAAATATATATATDDADAAAANILKNMIRRRANTSTLVFQLYMYANIQKGAVTYIYPASASTPVSTPVSASASVLKSLTSTHLKTAAAMIHKLHIGSGSGIESIYNDYVAATAHPRHNTSSEAPAVGGRYPPATATATPSTRLSVIKYSRKDIIFLALVCYMKIDESDINTKGIFISATKEEIMAPPPPPAPSPSPSPSPSTPSSSPYDEKYKYLLT
jgi:hypothetical protein